MMNRRQFGTYLGVTLLGLATGALVMKTKSFAERYAEGFKVRHIHPPFPITGYGELNPFIGFRWIRVTP